MSPKSKLTLAWLNGARAEGSAVLESVISQTSDPVGARAEPSLAAARRVLATAIGVFENALTSTHGAADTGVNRVEGMDCVRWTLVDLFDRDGRTYVVARASGSSTRGMLALTGAERRVVIAAATGMTTKEIAHTLGIADTTVRVLLMRAARRCAVRDRKALLRLWATLSGAERQSP